MPWCATASYRWASSPDLRATICRALSKTCYDVRAEPAVAPSSITRLFVDGQLKQVATSPNYVIPLGNGYIIVNEQIGFMSPFGASFTVTALRAVIYGVADLKFSRTHAISIARVLRSSLGSAPTGWRSGEGRCRSLRSEPPSLHS